MTDTDRIKKYRRAGLAIAFLIFGLDQLSKFLVMQPLQLPARGQIELLPFFNLTWAQNYGVSMGFLTASSDLQRWALVALTGLIGIAVFLWMNREKAKWDIVALGLILGVDVEGTRARRHHRAGHDPGRGARQYR